MTALYVLIGFIYTLIGPVGLGILRALCNSVVIFHH